MDTMSFHDLQYDDVYLFSIEPSRKKVDDSCANNPRHTPSPPRKMPLELQSLNDSQVRIANTQNLYIPLMLILRAAYAVSLIVVNNPRPYFAPSLPAQEQSFLELNRILTYLAWPYLVFLIYMIANLVRFFTRGIRESRRDFYIFYWIHLAYGCLLFAIHTAAMALSVHDFDHVDAFARKVRHAWFAQSTASLSIITDIMTMTCLHGCMGFPRFLCGPPSTANDGVDRNAAEEINDPNNENQNIHDAVPMRAPRPARAWALRSIYDWANWRPPGRAQQHQNNNDVVLGNNDGASSTGNV